MQHQLPTPELGETPSLAQALWQLGQSSNPQEVKDSLDALKLSVAASSDRAPSEGDADPNLAEALLQLGLSTNLREIKDSLDTLKLSMAKLKQERQALLDKQKLRPDSFHSKEDSWRKRGYWVIG